MEKDIENLARGEVKYVKWSREGLEVVLSGEGHGVCQRQSWGGGVRFPFTPGKK